MRPVVLALALAFVVTILVVLVTACANGNYLTVEIENIPCNATALHVHVDIDGDVRDRVFDDPTHIGDGTTSFVVDLKGHTSGHAKITIELGDPETVPLSASAEVTLPASSVVVQFPAFSGSCSLVDAGVHADAIADSTQDAIPDGQPGDAGIDALTDAKPTLDGNVADAVMPDAIGDAPVMPDAMLDAPVMDAMTDSFLQVDGGGSFDAGCTWPFVPNNYDACAGFPASQTTLTLSDGVIHNLNTDTNQLDGAAPVGVDYISTGNVHVLLLHRVGFTVGIGTTLKVTGKKPLLIVSDNDIMIGGTVTVETGSTIGDASCGPIASVMSSLDSAIGGGGGGFGTAGGMGGSSGAGLTAVQSGQTGQPANGTMTIIPLRPGCPGSSGGTTTTSPGYPGGAPGKPGGALALSAKGLLTVTSMGSIHAEGTGGSPGVIGPAAGCMGNDCSSGGGGGGSGGALVLEGSVGNFFFNSKICATGGGGGAGGASNGTVTSGSAGNCAGGAGGVGSPENNNGGAGAATASAGNGLQSLLEGSGGGGGGGAGRIFLHFVNTPASSGLIVPTPSP